MKYTEQAVETLDDAGSVIANKNIEIEQLRQRVAELEEDRDKWRTDCQTYCDAMHKREAAITSLQVERDKATQYWNIAEGRCDALKQQRDELLAALETTVKDDSHNPSLMVMIAEEAIASVKEKQDAAD